MAEKPKPSPLAWILKANSYYSLGERAKHIYEATPPVDQLKVLGVSVASGIGTWFTSLQWLDPGVAVIAGLLAVLVVAFFSFVWAAQKWSPINPAAAAVPPKATAPVPRPLPPPSLPKYASLYWDKQGRGKVLLMEIWNHAGYTQNVTVSCQSMEYWNGTQFAAALDAEQVLYSVPVGPKGLGKKWDLELVSAKGEEFQLNALARQVRHSAVGTWRLTLAIGSDDGQYRGIKTCFYWNPKKQDPLRYVECPASPHSTA
jgi:hypothetical protein